MAVITIDGHTPVHAPGPTGRQNGGVTSATILVYHNMAVEGAMVSWDEPACLVITRATRGIAGTPDREIVAEGTFGEIVKVFGRYHVDQWDRLTISFTERRKPPFRYERDDFARHVISRMIIPQILK